METNHLKGCWGRLDHNDVVGRLLRATPTPRLIARRSGRPASIAAVARQRFSALPPSRPRRTEGQHAHPLTAPSRARDMTVTLRDRLDEREAVGAIVEWLGVRPQIGGGAEERARRMSDERGLDSRDDRGQLTSSWGRRGAPGRDIDRPVRGRRSAGRRRPMGRIALATARRVNDAL